MAASKSLGEFQCRERGETLIFRCPSFIKSPDDGLIMRTLMKIWKSLGRVGPYNFYICVSRDRVSFWNKYLKVFAFICSENLLTYLLTCSLSHLVTCSLNPFFTYSLSHLLTYSLTHSLTHLLTYSLTH